MSHDELLSLAKDFFENPPSLLHDFIIRKQGSAPEQSSQATTPPSWCKCRHCIEMPTAKESVFEECHASHWIEPTMKYA